MKHTIVKYAPGGSTGNEKDPLACNVMSAAEPLNATGSALGSSSKDLVDLEALVLSWAKQIFEVTKTKSQAKINKKHLQVNIFIDLFDGSFIPCP
ncbi:unnamed protein product [Gongylonema pulchrum]|uniref:Uncharacterized protein n=1 Tax=Gongylonema pulchrum TaxID=637853 RepID=A0A183DSV4_9BILA|nr:unnamed protein product [Gongylonema pulchrum]